MDYDQVKIFTGSFVENIEYDINRFAFRNRIVIKNISITFNSKKNIYVAIVTHREKED